jgi:hypothetical protein
VSKKAKKMYGYPKFIEDSSSVGNKTGMRDHTAKQHGGHRPYAEKSSKEHCVALGSNVWCIHGKHWGYACIEAHLRARARRAKPKGLVELALGGGQATEQQSGGVSRSSALTRRGERVRRQPHIKHSPTRIVFTHLLASFMASWIRRKEVQMSESKALNAYKKLPLSFIPNECQTDEAVRYYAQGAGYIPSDLVVTAELITAA